MEGFFSQMTNNINSHAHHLGGGHPAATNGTNNHQRSVQNQATNPNNSNSTSNNEKQFKCDFCDKTFTQRRNQRAHIRTVHEKLKPFQCTHCGLTANRKFNLLSHIKKMHGTTEGTAVVDTRLSGASAASVASSPVASASNHHSHGSKSKKSNPTHSGPSVSENIHHTQQCLVCSAPVKLAVNKYFCDKCEPRFTAPATAGSAAGVGNYLSNVQGRNFNSPASGAHRPPTQNPQTFRCLQCPFVTEDSSAMIGHHLHAHSSYPMPM